MTTRRPTTAMAEPATVEPRPDHTAHGAGPRARTDARSIRPTATRGNMNHAAALADLRRRLDGDRLPRQHAAQPHPRSVPSEGAYVDPHELGGETTIKTRSGAARDNAARRHPRRPGAAGDRTPPPWPNPRGPEPETGTGSAWRAPRSRPVR